MALQEKVRDEVAQRRSTGALNVVERPFPPDPEGASAPALDAALERLLECLRGACASPAEWPLKVKAAVGAALAFAAAQPGDARLLCLDPLSVDAEVASHLLAGNERLAALLAEGRRHCPQAEDLPRLTELALVNGALALIGRRLAEGDTGDIAELEPRLVRILLFPYVGDAEAARLATS